MLGLGIVDGHDRQLEHAVFFHGPQPDDARRGLFHAGHHVGHQLLALGRGQGRRPLADLVVEVVEPVQRDEDHRAHQVGAVVHRDIGLVLQGGRDVPVIAVLVFALDRVGRDSVILHQAGRDVVLGRQRVGGAQQEVGTAGLQGLGQVGGFGRDVQAGRHSHSGQRLFLLEPLADRPQDGHVALGPLDSFAALFSQRQVFDVPSGGGGGHGCQFKYSLTMLKNRIPGSISRSSNSRSGTHPL